MESPLTRLPRASRVAVDLSPQAGRGKALPKTKTARHPLGNAAPFSIQVGCGHLMATAPEVRLDCVLRSLDRAGAHDLAGRLGLEGHCFAGEGVGALACLGGGLLDDDELGEAGNEEHAALLQLFIAEGRHGLDNALDV